MNRLKALQERLQQIVDRSERLIEVESRAFTQWQGYHDQQLRRLENILYDIQVSLNDKTFSSEFSLMHGKKVA